MTTYQDILSGLHERFAMIATLDPNRILDYEPGAADSQPLLYSLFDRYDVTQGAQLDKHTFRILHRVVVTWQDNQGAELLLMPFLASVPAAIHADMRLGGRLTEGYARIVEATGVFVVIGGVLCRGYDFVSESFFKQGRTA